ncbi:MAG: SpoIIE family protein phosphatase [Flavobacteriia bacterium]|nr:SpoIIE family protein phosphatase [Flavobacteriia bacterium]
MNKIIIILLLFFAQNFYSQTREIDSLYNSLKTSKRDTVKVQILNQLSQKLGSINPDISLRYAQKARALAEVLNFKNGEIRAYSNIGLVYYGRGDFPNALNCFLYAEKLLDKYPNDYLLSDIYNNIALVYVQVNKVEIAFDYFNKTIKLDKKANNSKGLGDAYNNLGSIYGLKKQLLEAKKYFELSLKYRLIANDKDNLPLTLSNLSSVNIFQNNFSTAVRQINQALLIYEKNDDIIGVSMIYNKIGDLKTHQKKYKDAIVYYQKSLKLSKQYAMQRYMQHSYEELALLYEKLEDYKKANFYYKVNAKIKDRIFNSENAKHLSELQAKYESEKKQREILKRNSEIERKNFQINIFRIGFIIIIFLVIYIVYSLRDKSKINKIIIKQKQDVEYQNQIIEEKNLLVSTQNKDIKDSIKYAKRIQKAILPPKEFWNKILPDSFVIYRPKDILSGDFNWIAETNSHIFIAAADCTGHGVPGALISIVNYNLLNKAVLEKGLANTGEILDAVNEWLTDSLHQKVENSTVKDGMDISLISINKENGEIYFSGAYNSLFVVTGNQIVQYKGNKFPVGSFLDEQLNHFSTNKVQVEKGSMLYLFTDGYPDQFGGAKGKKFKYKNLKENLLKISSFDLEFQRNYLLNSFNEWKGDMEQVDDVLFIGVKIN